ncbi:unnamed protein product, partial [Medioppia subpectinata]
GGALRSVTPTELAEIAARAALQAAKVGPELVQSVVVGNAIQISADDTPIIARGIVGRLGIPINVPGLSVNIQCGSGFQAIINAAQDIMLNDCDITLAVGVENMSLTPFMLRGARFGVKLSQTPPLIDALWEGLKDHNCNLRMGETAEKLGQLWGVAREDADRVALRSQQRWADAHKRGVFKEEIVPVPVKRKGRPVLFDTDEHPKPDTTAAMLAALRPVFAKDGSVTAGNASGVNDGAGALVLACEKAVSMHGLQPLARIVGSACVGVDPTIMGYGPVPTIRKVLEKTGLSLADMDVIEVNEAFGTQFAAVEKELALDKNKTNVNGSGISIGHPLGATGARIMTNLMYELRRRNGKYALGSACIGGGQGIAIIIENVR